MKIIIYIVIFRRFFCLSSFIVSSNEVRVDVSRFVDLSHVIENGMPVYPGDPEPLIEKESSIEEDGVNLTRLVTGSHVGTHVDAPLHFVEGGSSLDEIPLSTLIGEGVVLDLSYKEVGSGISREDFEKFSSLIRRGDIVLVYTGTSDHWGEEGWDYRKFSYIEESGAKWLLEKGVKMVGIDCMSVEKFGYSEPITHLLLLSAGVPLIESLSKRLGELAGKRGFVICLPLKLGGVDGGPARVIACPIE